MEKREAENATSSDVPYLSVTEAAGVLGVSVGTLRRWEASGRVRAERTAGGHRRFPADEVQRLLGAGGDDDAHLSAFGLPRGPLPGLAATIADGGTELIERALRLTYSGHPNGWLCSDVGREQVIRWLDAVEGASRTGDYSQATAASRKLARVARAAGASMVECDSFMELIRALAGRAVSARAPAEATSTWQLMVVMRQEALGVYAAGQVP